jgi:hypothetical protein
MRAWPDPGAYMINPPRINRAGAEFLAGEKIYEYAFFGACIKLRGATGAPMRPIAMPLRT